MLLSHPLLGWGGGKKVHNFHKGMSPKVNVRLEFEIAYDYFAVQYISFNATRNPCLNFYDQALSLSVFFFRFLISFFFRLCLLKKG